MNLEWILDLALKLIINGTILGFLYFLVDFFISLFSNSQTHRPMRYAVYGLISYGLMNIFETLIPTIIYIFFLEDIVWYSFFEENLDIDKSSKTNNKK